MYGTSSQINNYICDFIIRNKQFFNIFSFMKIFNLFPQMKSRFLYFSIFIFSFNLIYSQNNYTIYFQEQSIDIPENIQTFEWEQMPEKSMFNNGYFGWIQFYETPNQIIQDRLKQADLKLLDYITNRTYLFYFPENTSIDFLRQ